MDKIITINLGGYAIKMEEDAYEALKPYIRHIEDTFANSENGKEIVNDIEARIAEMLIERSANKVAADLGDVEFVKKEMGNPGEFDTEETSERTTKTEIPYESIPRRFYRDADNKVFGGVCSGLAHYFKIDPVVVRLIWIGLIFFFGTGVLIYFILWVIVPEAITTAQKLEMKGEAPTLDNIVNRVKTEAEKVEQNIKSQNFGQKIQSIIQSFSPLVRTLFKAVAMFASLVLLTILTIIIILLLTGKGGINYNENEFSFHNIPNFLNTDLEFIGFKIIIGLLICIPLFNILISLLKFAFNSSVNYRPVRRFLSYTWLAAIPFLIYFIYVGVNNFKSRQTISSESTELIKGDLLIKSDFNSDFYNSIELKIEPSDDSLVHIIIHQSANGKTRKDAEKLAEKNGASYTINNNTLLLKSGSYFETAGIFRGQSIEFLIQIPNKKSFTIDKSVPRGDIRVKGQNITYFSDDSYYDTRNLLFLSNNLYCPSCPDSIPIGSRGAATYSNFSTIDAKGIFDIEVIHGNAYSVQKTGSSRALQHLEIWQNGSTLNIELEEEYFFNKSRPKIIITMPMLERIELAGAVICQMDHFAGDQLQINLSGVSKTKMDVEYDKIYGEMSGVSQLEIRGNSNDITFDISGASKLYASQLNTDNTLLNVSGASEIYLGPTKSINGEVSGASKIEYNGNPTLNIKSSGVSKIKQVQ